MIPISIHILGIDTIQLIDQETHHTIDIEIIPTIGTEVFQIIAINNKLIDPESIQTIVQIAKDLIITIIKIDHEKIHSIGITHVIQTLKTNIVVIHQNIRDK